jgi:glycosyltransferase involved in cell wall biosynthesis
MPQRYCLITPVRDEAQYARRTLEAVARQSVRPALWLLIDDGSTDATPDILDEYARKFDWIRVIHREDRGFRKLGGGVIDAFYAGYDQINPHDFDYVCKLDLDLDLPPVYFERLMEKMAANPRIGTASGKPWFFKSGEDRTISFPITESSGLIREVCGDENSVGMIKFYRTDCFEEIGGFVRELRWDGIDGHRCRMLGWIAVSWDEPELRFHHLRPMGTSHKNWWTGRVRHGVGQYFMGTHPLYLLASAAFRVARPPVGVGAAAMVWGYFRSALQRRPRYGDEAFRQFLRHYQISCLLHGKKSATARLNQEQTTQWSTRHEGPADSGFRVQGSAS